MVSGLTSSQVQIFQNVCEKICSESKIKFCGIIDEMGSLVVDRFKDGIKPLDNEDERTIWYMQSALEMSMKKEFGNNLGNIDYTVTYHNNTTLINIPIQNHVMLISTERNVDIKQLVNYSKKLFGFNCNNTIPEDRILSIIGTMQ
ncbi:MAG: hypothetical protein ACR2LL_08630 [Nitrosopumilus sp.]